MAPKTRRTHTKSRGGCLECKRRKKKCDEVRPTCSGCIKRCIPCEFLAPSPASVETPSTTVIESESYSPTSDLPNNSPPDEGPSDGPFTKRTGHFDMDDLTLWHQFLSETAVTMSGPWETEIPKLALSCDYLAHAIMCLAALHLAYLKPEERPKYEYLAAQHQDLALAPFRRAVVQVTPENCNQVFAFSAFLITAQFAPSRSSKVIFPPLSVSLYNGPANWIVCHRACDSIVRDAMPHMRSGPLGAILAQGQRACNVAKEVSEFPENEDDESLVYLSQNMLTLPIVKSTTTVDEMEAYTEAISWLRRLLVGPLRPADSLESRILAAMWPTQVRDSFIRALKEERPPALIITAHYCLLLHRCRGSWHMEHRAYDLLTAVQQSLTVEWSPYLERVVRVVQGS